MEISLPTDTDGFLSQECPSCGLRFKVTFGQGSEAPISYCPYCGYEGANCWHTQEQVNYIQAVAINIALMPELKKLKLASGGLLKFNMKSDISNPTAPPIEADEPMTVLHFPCCNESIKVERYERHFCIICGTEVDMNYNESKKVFLSHKGLDKEMVRDFKQTLELIGYAPWIDEDAMVAGTSLEREILQGMRDSCGVVFFITPSFEDERYLASEVDYAVREKRHKGDRFAIVALQFIDKDGNEGKIPDLLANFVWKKPKTRLEALREIIRALPIVPGAVEWKPNISGVVSSPKIKSTSTELSLEAKEILQKAVSGDGRIVIHTSMAGKQLLVGSTFIAPSNDPRTTALWFGGLEDLQRRRFIKDVGYNQTAFKVTREGYEAADQLTQA